MVWPSLETGCDLMDKYFALPEYERKKNETTLESYLKKKTGKIDGKLRNTQKKNMEHTIDQLMVQLSGDRRLDDLNLNEIYLLISFLKDEIMNLRKKLDFMHYPPLQDPPMNPIEVQSKEPRTTTNDVFMIEGSQEDERARKTNEGTQRISIDVAIKENQSHYLFDQWIFPLSEPSNPHIDKQIKMQMGSDNKKSEPWMLSSIPRSSSGNPNLEMEPIVPPMVTFHGLSREEQSNISNSDSLFNRSNNTMTTNDGIRSRSTTTECCSPSRVTTKE